jgi:RelE-like toxin of type II toxin-antitoxin system HigB
MGEFWHNGEQKRVSPEIAAHWLRKLDMLNRAVTSKDLQAPPANHLHALHGDREGQWASRSAAPGDCVADLRKVIFLILNFSNIIEGVSPCYPTNGVRPPQEKS